MIAPVPLAPPVMPPTTDGTVHEKVAPAGTIPLVPLVGVTVKVEPLHTTPVIEFTIAKGFSEIRTVKVEPVHPAVTGVTI